MPGPRREDALAETGPGIPDEAVADGELTPGELDEGADAEAERLKRKWKDEAPEGAGATRRGT